MSISNEVSSLESENESLKAENKLLNNSRIINEFELSTLRRANDKLQAERDEARDSAAQMKVILDQAGAAIVQGMGKFHAARRVAQEANLSGWRGRPPTVPRKQQSGDGMSNDLTAGPKIPLQSDTE